MVVNQDVFSLFPFKKFEMDKEIKHLFLLSNSHIKAQRYTKTSYRQYKFKESSVKIPLFQFQCVAFRIAECCSKLVNLKLPI